MTVQDKARIITRDTKRLIPKDIRQTCQRIIIGKAFHEPVDRSDISSIKSIYQSHYANAIYSPH